ncbi:MAG: TnpV protein [Oscillospiraceae bacterium]|nr:TnpV protein [Oscillospiraceae bacterium]
MELAYTLVGDYYIPNLTFRDSPNDEPLGRYARLRRAYLREHRPILYNRLLLCEELFTHLREIDAAAENRLRTIADREQAHETILAELVYD